MKVCDLQNGQFFHTKVNFKSDDIPGIVARKVDDNAVYLNSQKIVKKQAGTGGFHDSVRAWGNIEVEIIDFPQSLILLAQECLYIKEDQPFFDPNERVEAATLELGRYFITENGNVGRIFQPDRFVYLKQGSVWDYTSKIPLPVVPLSMQHAVLFLAQQLAAA
jgi:hypothetical protein